MNPKLRKPTLYNHTRKNKRNKNMLRCLLSFFLYSVCFFSSFAQQSQVKFTHLTNLDGLSQSSVQAIVKDKYGFMWFGTQDGLNRYDGYTFKVYRHISRDTGSLRRSNIMSLYEDHQGNLWVGTNNGALSLYDRKHDSFIHFRESNGDYKGLSQKSVTAIYEDRQNNLWVGTYWKLNLLNRKTGEITQFGNDPLDSTSISGDGINCIFEDSKNNLWIGTSTGLNILNRKTKKFKRYLHDDKNPGSLSDNTVRVITEDNRGRVWIGSNQGLNLFDAATASFTPFKQIPGDPNSVSDQQITAIADEGNGTLWVGTSTSLELFDVDKGVFTHFKNDLNNDRTLHRNGSVMSILLDKEGILWVGTYMGGINKYDRHLTIFDLYKNIPFDEQSLSSSPITSFSENAAGDIWVGTGGGGINLWKRSANKFSRYNPTTNNKNSLGSSTVLCLAQSKKNNYLWIGTYGSCIDRYDPKTNLFKHYTKGDAPDQLNNDAVYALYEDSKGNIWMGTNGGGVNVLDPNTGIIKKYSTDPNIANTVAGNYVRCFFEDKKENIWIGTTSGISVFNPATRMFTRYDQSNTTLESDIIFSMHEDKRGIVWIGTLGGGLNRLDPQTKKIITYTTNDGLPDNTINSIEEDDKGCLWLSTNNGISRFDPAKVTFKNSSLHNGIQGFEFSQGAGLKTNKGEILFGGVNGFNAFNPNQLVENKNILPVVITGFKLFNKPITIDEKNSPLKEDISQTKEITLSYRQSILTFEFAALGFTASEKNQYAYMLEGFDKNWNYVGQQRAATYTNLDPGTYVFKVKASNNDGFWNEEPTSITIIVTPPYWKTWWFKALISLLLIGIAFSFYKWRIRSINAQKRLLEQQVLDRTESLTIMTEDERKARLRADQAVKELEIKNTELEQFAYVASHDMQEPLRTTSSFVQLLQEQYKGKLDNQADKYLTFIARSSERMKILIKDLLDYSRIGRKKESVKVDCNQVLQDVLADIETAINETAAEIKADQLPVIHGYSTEMKQLFQNLAVNAIKFRRKDTHPQIKISAEQKDDYWEFAFSDNGIGMLEEHSERIFHIFQRLHTRTEYEGSGIGLAHCKKIAELHGGRIWVKSVLGQGSTFYFVIKKK
jgi:ligand-binding sensor domain-containing protein/signal transduction histidine kinase